jgi:hypothetical protein
MRKAAALVSSAVVVVLFSTSLLFAQDPPPEPPCCPRSPVSGMASTEAQVLASFTAPEAWLQANGLTRALFADRLAAVFFPAEGAQYLVTWKRTTVVETSSGAASSGGFSAGDKALVQVEEKYTYRFRRPDLSESLLNGAEEFLLTDGVTSIRVSVPRASTTATAQP